MESEFAEATVYPQTNNSHVSPHVSPSADRVCIKGSTFIGEYLFELWKNQCLCDVKLQVGEKSFLAHKLVLAAFSEVFCPSQPRIRPTVCIDVPGTTPEAIYQILMYLYTSEMHLTDCNLEAVLTAACFMGITDIVDMVRAILDRPTVENLQLYMTIRMRQGMPHSILDFPKLLKEHFTDLVDHNAFMCCTFEELETMLQNPDLMVTSEMDTVRAVISWLEYNPLDRTQHTARLLELVNLECVDTAELVRLKEEKRHLFDDVNASEIIMDAFIKRAKACSDNLANNRVTASASSPHSAHTAYTAHSAKESEYQESEWNESHNGPKYNSSFSNNFTKGTGEPDSMAVKVNTRHGSNKMAKICGTPHLHTPGQDRRKSTLTFRGKQHNPGRSNRSRPNKAGPRDESPLRHSVSSTVSDTGVSYSDGSHHHDTAPHHHRSCSCAECCPVLRPKVARRARDRKISLKPQTDDDTTGGESERNMSSNSSSLPWCDAAACCVPSANILTNDTPSGHKEKSRHSLRRRAAAREKARRRTADTSEQRLAGNTAHTGNMANKEHTAHTENKEHTAHAANKEHTEHTANKEHTECAANKKHTAHTANKEHTTHTAHTAHTAHTGQRSYVCQKKTVNFVPERSSRDYSCKFTNRDRMYQNNACVHIPQSRKRSSSHDKKISVKLLDDVNDKDKVKSRPPEKKTPMVSGGKYRSY